MKKAIVIGDTGFLGSNLVEMLLNKNYEIIGISHSNYGKINHVNYKHYNIDLNQSSIYSYLIDFNPQYLYHLVANPLIKYHNSDITLTNIFFTHKLLDDLYKSNISCKFIFSSSAAIYNPIKTIYSISKETCEEIIKWYQLNNKIKDYLIFRYCAHIGKNSTHGVVHDIINKIYSDSKFLELIGDEPGSIKPFLSVEESMNLTIDLSEKESNKIYDITPDDNISIKELVNIIMEELKIFKPIRWTGNEQSWPGDQKYIKLKTNTNYSFKSSREVIIDYIRSIK